MAENYFVDKAGRVRFVLSVRDAAMSLKTSPDNIYALINLGMIQSLQLSNVQTISLTEIQRFIDDNLGKDLQEIIADAKHQKGIRKQLSVLKLKEG